MTPRETPLTSADRLKEALEANARITRLPGLRKMADQASRITSGKVCFAYTTQPEATEYYVFQPGGERCNLKRAIEFLQDVIVNPDKYVVLTEDEKVIADRERNVQS